MGGGAKFEPKKILKKPRFLECAQVLVVSFVKLNSINDHLSLSPTSNTALVEATWVEFVSRHIWRIARFFFVQQGGGVGGILDIDSKHGD